MKVKIVVLLLAIILTVCGSMTTPASTVASPTFTPTVTFAIPTQSPIPTQPPVLLLKPDAIQVERWREYQTEMAKIILSDGGDVFPLYENALCEWDILGRSVQEVYVWAECIGPSTGGRGPAVLHLRTDESIEYVRVPGHGSMAETNIQKMFPVEVQGKIELYYSSLSYGRAKELADHLQYRLTHLEVPPLIILSATLTATPAP